MDTPKTLLRQYLKTKGMRRTEQREQILHVFSKTEKHPTIADLCDMVKKKNPKIGIATVYRTMKVMCDAGLARKVDFADGMARFEHKYQHDHHDHLVCLRCNKCIEVSSPEIEALQDSLARKHRFMAVRHRMEIFGMCSTCKGKRKREKK